MPSDRQKAKSVGVCLGAEGHRSGERDARFLEEEDEWKNRMETEKSEELTVQAPSTDRRALVGSLLLLLPRAVKGKKCQLINVPSRKPTQHRSRTSPTGNRR
jgi:hypothetical protein